MAGPGGQVPDRARDEDLTRSRLREHTLADVQRDPGEALREHFDLPGVQSGADLDADLTGTWALSRGGVTFDQTADTFIRDVRFTADRNRLIGEATIGHQIVALVLTKAE